MNFPALVDQIVIDSRRIDSSCALFVALKGSREDGHSYVSHAAKQKACFALVSEKWIANEEFSSLILLRVVDPLEAFQQIAKAYRLQLPTKILAITGSFGKTMVKDLLVSLLKTTYQVAASPESFNSQIGVPLSLLTINSSHQLAVIEAAASQKEEMKKLAELICPDYTLLTPLGKKHLNTLKDLSTVTSELGQLIQSTSAQGWTLISHQILPHFVSSLSCSIFKWDEPFYKLPHATALSVNRYQIQFPDHEIVQSSIETGHAYFLNLINMTVKAAWLFKISKEQIKIVLQNYQLTPTRTEIWRSVQGATFVNDLYCSDPQSIDQAFSHFRLAAPHERKIFVFGGMKEGSLADYKQVGNMIAEAHLQQLIVVGNHPFTPLIQILQDRDKQIKVLAFATYEESFDYLHQFLQLHDLILIKGSYKISLEKLNSYFHDHLSSNQCTINLAAIQNNLEVIRKKLPLNTRLMIIVKALAYGTDSLQIAKCLLKCGVDILGVSYVEEAIALKRGGASQKIFAINAAPYEVKKVVKWELEVGVSDEQLIELLAEEAKLQNKVIFVHLHLNTGMTRFGCRPERALALAKQIEASSHLKLQGLMTHLACAEDPKQDEFTYSQVASLDAVATLLHQHHLTPPWIHAANSSAVLRFHLPQYNMVRIGLALFGLYLSEEIKESVDLKLAFSLTSRIVGINECIKGETVSYGRHYFVEKETQRIAVLPIGYFDGLHRHYSGRSYVLIHGQKAPMVGNICMDYMMVDITDISEAKIGDKVLIFGEDEFGNYLSPEDLASRGNSIIHELITCLGPRIQRIFIYEEAKQFR